MQHKAAMQFHFKFVCALAGAALFIAPTLADAAPKKDEHHSGRSFHLSSSAGQLGAQVMVISDNLRRYFGAPKDVGVLVDSVEPGAPAAKAGLRSGDVITGLDGQAIATPLDIFRALSAHKKGDKVKVEVVRGKKKKILEALLDGSSALRMHWSWGYADASPFGKDHSSFNDPFGPKQLFSPETPFARGHFLDPFELGGGHPFAKGFPFKAQEELQEKVRDLEKRLRHLEQGRAPRKSKK